MIFGFSFAATYVIAKLSYDKGRVDGFAAGYKRACDEAKESEGGEDDE